jgi:peptidoglycan/LPS O-acetylase OafA/YrhL
MPNGIVTDRMVVSSVANRYARIGPCLIMVVLLVLLLGDYM